MKEIPKAAFLITCLQLLSSYSPEVGFVSRDDSDAPDSRSALALHFCLLLLVSGLLCRSPGSSIVVSRLKTLPTSCGYSPGSLVWCFAAMLAWLQIGRVLTPTMAIILGVALFIIEFLIRMWERSRWKPGQSTKA